MKRELSKKQEKVLKLYLAGYGPKEIGRIMNLNINTICSYKKIIMDKWEVETNIELIIEAIRRGYIEIEKDEYTPQTETRTESRSFGINYTYIPSK